MDDIGEIQSKSILIISILLFSYDPLCILINIQTNKYTHLNLLASSTVIL